MLVKVGVDGDVTAGLAVGEGEVDFFSCHSFLFSVAHEPHELK
jgi:hypothetical protein